MVGELNNPTFTGSRALLKNTKITLFQPRTTRLAAVQIESLHNLTKSEIKRFPAIFY